MEQRHYTRGLELNQLFQDLLVAMCHHPDGLFDILKEYWLFYSIMYSVTDEFTCNLVEIAKKAIVSPHFQPVVLGLLRSDYMIESEEKGGRMLQIELNTISCSFTGEEEPLTKMHQHVLGYHASSVNAISHYMHIPVESVTTYIENDHFNETAEQSAASLYEAIEYYNQQ